MEEHGDGVEIDGEYSYGKEGRGGNCRRRRRVVSWEDEREEN